MHTPAPTATSQRHADIEQVHRLLLQRSPIYHFLLQDIRILSVDPPPPLIATRHAAATPSPSPSSPQQPPASSSLSPLSPPAALVVAHLPLSHVHLNSHASLHGAVAATIVDWAGGIVIASAHPSAPLDAKRGLSVDIHLRYLSPAAKLGDTLIIRASSRKVGRTLAFVSIELSVRKPKKKMKNRNTAGAASRPPPSNTSPDPQQAPHQHPQQKQVDEQEPEEEEEICVVEASHTKCIV